ncbi:U2 snRNP-associated SURP motif-containing protein [Grifola frondosa]|uniref:U2 snRNP-associated SURP motif-containing protein n=1 Tax=Grifola frondosa TaxID=5627 RepID=A0A1C7LTV4_GRIFR|nr:U2 snRNP-associated SURP motif-containing protein [Grifola frondosa]
MDKTKSKLAAFFDNDDEESSFPQKEVDDQKRSLYTQGTVRKSRREKEKEAAEAKRKEEEENAARAYAEFLDAFQGEGADRKKGASMFVKGGQDAGTSYAPSLRGKSQSSAPSRAFEEESMRPPSPQLPAPKPKGKRAMDSFLEEIKREQADREARLSRHVTHGRSVTSIAAYEGQSGSKDRGDPQTSNVFVANLPPHVSEQSLGNFFARVGPVGSVKIMWPRGDASVGPGADMTASRRSKNSGLSGFVSFMKRKDAEEALRELDGFDWGGSILRVGWSKAVPIAAKAMYIAKSPLGLGKDEDDEVTEQFIRTVAVEVKGHDEEYEKNLKERELGNPKFAFLKKDHRRYKYYRSMVDRKEPLEPEFDDDGYNSVYSTDSAEESEREHGRKHELGKLARRRFEAMLRALSGKRGELARCMAFSLEHAEAASEVSDIIIASLMVDGTPVPRKVARLHLICDILHNSAAPLPMAWKFRQEFQSRLGLVFDHLSTIYHSFPGRITAETFKKQITSVVDIWEDWIVFPPDFTAELRARLEGETTKEVEASDEQVVSEVKESSTAFTSKFKASSFRPAEVVALTGTGAVVGAADADEHDGESMDEGSDIDGKPMDDVDGVPIDLDLDGVPIDDVDGEPMDDDIDGVPMDDVDGEPMDDAPIDGEPMDEDLDGAPIDV